MSASPETPYAEYWPDAYRFACLMTGGAGPAQAAINALVPAAAERLTQMRDGRQAKRWLFSRLREQCRQAAPVPAAASDPGQTMPAEEATSADAVRLFSHLPEEERCALALFYLNRFEPDELTEVLELSTVALGRLLDAARLLLGRRHPVAPAAVVPAGPLAPAGDAG